MLKKRIIPCLDVKNGRTVKGVNFEDLRDAGDAVALAYHYSQQGADELVFLDITATLEGRNTFIELVKEVAKTINIPFTVGGGIRTTKDVEVLLSVGADKVSINSSAVKTPDLINELSLNFGCQCVVVAIDTKNLSGNDEVYINAGTKATGKKTVDWAKEVFERGAGEILLTSMNSDGTKKGFANEITAKVSESISIPVIASGGAGNMEHFVEVFTNGKADAALAASIFHFGEIKIPELKKYLNTKNIPVRI